jgi:hypothetical protein
VGPTGKSLAELAFADADGTREPNPDPGWADLPPVCVITGAKDNVVTRKVTLSWFPRWVLLLALVPAGSVLLAGIVALFMTKKASGYLPFSDRGWFRWRVAKIVTPISIFWVLGAIFVGMSFDVATEALQAALAWGAMVAVPLALYWTLQRNRMVVPVRITDSEIALKIPSEEAARAVVDFLYPGGGTGQAAPMFTAAR